MQELPVINFHEFKTILERCDCTVAIMARYGELMVEEGDPTPALYSIERGQGAELRFAVIHIWDPYLPIPHDTIRSTCSALDLGPDIFGLKH